MINLCFYCSVICPKVVSPGKEGGGPEGGEDFLGRGSERRGSGPE